VELVLGTPLIHKAESNIVVGMSNDAGSVNQRFPLFFRELLERIHTVRKKCVILVDMSPNSSIVNQNILLSCDYLVLPCNPDDNSLISQQLLMMYLPVWRNFHARYLQHTTKLLCVVMNRYKTGKNGIENHLPTKTAQLYIRRSMDLLAEFCAKPSNSPFLVNNAAAQFFKVQNGLSQIEIASANHVSLFELRQQHAKASDGSLDQHKIDSLTQELDHIVEAVLAGVLQVAAAPAEDSDGNSQMNGE
jgi:hypothetical protein